MLRLTCTQSLKFKSSGFTVELSEVGIVVSARPTDKFQRAIQPMLSWVPVAFQLHGTGICFAHGGRKKGGRGSWREREREREREKI